MKGQLKLEFILGIVLFSIVIFFLASQINSNFRTISSDAYLDTLKAKGIDATNFILYNYSSETKISGINCTALEEKYDLGGYRIKFTRNTTDIKTCGFAGSRYYVTIERNIVIDGQEGTFRLDLL